MCAEIFLADIEVEDRGDADGPEKANDNSLTPLLDLVDATVHKENDGWSAEEKNEDSQRNQAVDRDNVVVCKHMPRTDGAKPNKDCDIEEHVDRGLQRIVGGLYAEPVVPSEGVASHEAGKDIVAADKAVSTDDEELAMSVVWLDLATKY